MPRRDDFEPRLERKYERLLESGEYESLDELCNDLGLNYDDLYEENLKDDDDDEEEFHNYNRRSKPLFPETVSKSIKNNSTRSSFTKNSYNKNTRSSNTLNSKKGRNK